MTQMKNSKILVLAILAYLPTHIYGQDMKLNLEQTPEDLKKKVEQKMHEESDALFQTNIGQLDRVYETELKEPSQFPEISNEQRPKEISDVLENQAQKQASFHEEFLENPIILNVAKFYYPDEIASQTSAMLSFFDQYPGLYNLLKEIPSDYNMRVCAIVIGIPVEKYGEVMVKALEALEEKRASMAEWTRKQENYKEIMIVLDEYKWRS